MFGSHFPVAYVIKKKDEQPIPNSKQTQRFWLRTVDENTGVRYWTTTAVKAHIFSSKSICEDYIDKYCPDGCARVDERILNPYALLGGG